MISDELRVALEPDRAYATLVRKDAFGWGRRQLASAGVVLLVIATLIPIVGTGRITLGMFAVTAVAFSFVVVLQALTGVVLILSSSERRVPTRQAVALWFAGHLPYSLWLVLFSGWLVITRDLPPLPLLGSVVVPAVLTIRIEHAFCRVVLGTSSPGAWWRVGVQQAMAWSLVCGYIVLAAGGTVSVTSFFARELARLQ